MKRYILILLLIIAPARSAETPFKRGVNLTGWFQESSVRQIQFTKYTKQDLINIKSLGCDVIRLPINLHFMTNGEPDYTVEPLFFNFLDQVIDWAEELELHLIIDNHSFDPAEDTEPNIVDILVPVWTQMAEHYKERSNLIYYEVLNEPHGISDQIWNNIQQQVIDAIRQVDQKHTIAVSAPASCACCNSVFPSQKSAWTTWACPPRATSGFSRNIRLGLKGSKACVASRRYASLVNTKTASG